MTRLTLVRSLLTQSKRTYAPYQWAFRAFASSAHSQRASPQTNARQSSTQRTRVMDIHALHEVEDKLTANESELGRLSQQADEADIDNVVADQSSVVFADLPLSEILKRKEKYGTALHCVSENDSIHTAMQLMKSLRIGAVLVHSAELRGTQPDITGIISTRDFVTKVTEGADPRKTLAKDFMTESPVFAYADDTAIACLDLMQKHQFRHLPVRDRTSNDVIGLVSVGDLVRVMLENYKDSNRYMKDFINGQYN